jgi:NhaA family Na+:H+ antiporter
MAVFFLLVGLEIKRELVDGELSSWNKASLPLIAAIGGMAVPAAVYAWINAGTPETIRGWAIPAATDIAFALGVLSLVGKRVPPALKIFLLALAIIDDLGAILVIAILFTAKLSLLSLGLAAVGLSGLFLLNRRGVTRLAPYMLVGAFIWVCVLKSGVHATLAGVAVAFFIPLRAEHEDGHSPLRHLEHTLHPWVAYWIMPLFAFANAGVSFAGMSPGSLLEPLSLGIAAGLFLGKQVGVFGLSFLAVKARICRLPDGVGWAALYGMALLTGIGFTMSLFIGTLAFEGPALAAGVRLGVLAGTLLSALAGFGVLRLVTRARAEASDEPRP